MKINPFFIFLLLVFFFSIFLINQISITDINDLSLDTNSTIIAGEGEVCITPYTKIECENGLVCKLTSTTPHINGICVKPNETFEEDYVNRKEAFLKNRTTLSDKDILNN
jgi:hypothetical protein